MKEQKPKTLKLSQTTKTLSATFYAEQLPDGEDAFYNAIKAISPSDLIVVAIKHLGTAVKKNHYHVIIKKVDRNGSFVVRSTLKNIHVIFRPIEDDVLLSNHGIETTGSFSSCLLYLLHQSYSAKRLHKHPYEISDLVSNVPPDVIRDILDGCSTSSTKLKTDDMLDAARDAGYSLSDFDNMIESLNIKGLSSSMESRMRNAYFSGAEKSVREGRFINRLCLNISFEYGEYSYSTILAAITDALSEKSTVVFDGSIQKTIRIMPSTDAVIMHNPDMDYCPRYINKFLSQNVELLRSTTNFDLIDSKAIWAGDFFICLGFPNGLSRSDIRSSWFFQCKVSGNNLICESTPSNVNEFKDAAAIRAKYDYFKQRFNNSLAKLKSHPSNDIFFQNLND